MIILSYIILFLSVIFSATYDIIVENNKPYSKRKDIISKIFHSIDYTFLIIGTSLIIWIGEPLWLPLLAYGLIREVFFDPIFYLFTYRETSPGFILRNKWYVKLIKLILGKI